MEIRIRYPVRTKRAVYRRTRDSLIANDLDQGHALHSPGGQRKKTGPAAKRGGVH
jgi:hypothetical protein